MGILAIGLYLSFAAVSYLQYPTAYSPLTNWLSDLGNPDLNPSGAVFYKLAGVLTSIALIPFFVGLSKLNTGEKKMRILLTLAQVAGIIASASFFMTAIFPLGVNNAVHSFFSILLFMMFGTFEMFSASALRRKPGYPRWITYSGFSIAFTSFIIGVSSFWVDFFLGEWIMVAALMIYVVILVYIFRLEFNSHLPR
ncbi:MAG: hypothetical protein NTV61_07995 [Candidatus Bathyarchaeota archaeon]|nr:hypothetical protein [Candidatus Bathyarchaeota archaeon]